MARARASSPQRSSCRILPGAASRKRSTAVAWKAARTWSVSRAIAAPEGSVCNALIAASRPKRVLNQGMPAAELRAQQREIELGAAQDAVEQGTGGHDAGGGAV